MNAVAVVTMLLISRRRGGLVPMLITGAMLGVLIHGLGPLWLADPWEPHAFTLASAALLFLVWDATLGGRASLIATAVLAALLAEAQAGLTLFAVAMIAVADLGAVVRFRRNASDSEGRRGFARTMAVTGAVLVVLAIPPVVALARGEPGNVADLISSMRHPTAPLLGVADAGKAVALEFGHRAPWIRSSQPLEEFSTTVDVGDGWLSSAGVVLFAGVGALAWRSRKRFSVFAVIVGVGIAAATASLARLLGPLYFWIPEWTRALGFAAAVAVLWTVHELSRSRRGALSREPGVVVVLVAVVVIAGIACTTDAARGEPPTDPSVAAIQRLVQKVLPDVRDGTSLVTSTADTSRLLGSDPGLPTLVLDLERAGVDVVVERLLEDHYGDHRAAPARAAREVRLLTEGDPLPDGFEIAATEDPLSPAQRAARNRLIADHPELGPGFNPEDRLRRIQSDPELRRAAEALNEIPSDKVLTLALRSLP
jgi:hypothetical protein